MAMLFEKLSISSITILQDFAVPDMEQVLKRVLPESDSKLHIYNNIDGLRHFKNIPFFISLDGLRPCTSTENPSSFHICLFVAMASDLECNKSVVLFAKLLTNCNIKGEFVAEVANYLVKSTVTAKMADNLVALVMDNCRPYAKARTLFKSPVPYIYDITHFRRSLLRRNVIDLAMIHVYNTIYKIGANQSEMKEALAAAPEDLRASYILESRNIISMIRRIEVVYKTTCNVDKPIRINYVNNNFLEELGEIWALLMESLLTTTEDILSEEEVVNATFECAVLLLTLHPLIKE